MDSGVDVDGRYYARIHQSGIIRKYQPLSLPVAAFPDGDGSRSFRSLAPHHPQDGAFRGLFHAEFAVVPRLAGDASLRNRMGVVDALGENFFFYDRAGGLPRRMAPELSAFPHGTLAGCGAG